MAMGLPRRRFFHLVTGAAVLPAVSRAAWTLDYPTRPVRIIVGFPPGGPTDIFARLISEWLSKRLGQAFIVENRPGAGSTIGVTAVVTAPPDGYTLLLVSTSAVISAAYYRNLSFDLIPISCRFVALRSNLWSWWSIHRYQQRQFLNSLPMRRQIPGRSSWRQSAMAPRLK